MLIIGITGTIGAGKGTIVDFLQHKLGFLHFSVRSFLTKEIQKRGLLLNRDSMVLVANELRAKYAPWYIVEQLYQQALESRTNCIIESLRTPGEVEMLRQKGNFYLLAVDADPEIRYKRIQGRMNETDNITYEVFLENEQREMISEDPNKQNISKCIQMADFRLINNGNIDELYLQIEEILKRIEDVGK